MAKEKVVKICGYFIEFGILAIIFFIPVIFDFSMSSYNFFDLYKAVFFRIILVLMLLSFTVKVFINNGLNYRGNAKIFILAGLILISFFVSSFFSLHPAQSFWGDFFRQQGFYNFFNYLLFFGLFILNIENYKQLKRISIAVIASAFLVSAYGLVQYFNLDPLSWNESVNSERIFSTLGQPNFFGHWLIMVLPFSFYALIFIAKKIMVKFLVGLVFVMQLVCLVFTYSRAAWLGFLGSMFFLMIIWFFYKGFKKAAFGLMGLILIGVLFILSLNIISPVKLGDYNSVNLVNRLKSVSDFKGGSNIMRFYYLESAVKEIKQASYLRLLVGYGPEVLADIFMKYYRIDWGVHETINSLPDRAHNWLFDKILSLGFLGLLANLLFYIYFIYRTIVFLSVKQKYEPEDWLLIFLFSSLTAYCINNLFSFSLFTVSVYLYLILAICWIIINCKAEVKILNIRLTAFSKLLIFTLLFLVSAVFIYFNNINQARAEIFYMKALNSIKSSDCRGVINNMEKVISLSPNSNYYQENYLFLMVNCFSSVKDESAQKKLSENLIERIRSIGDNKTYGLLHNTARVYSSFGYYDKAYYAEAEKIFNDLIMNFPYFTEVYEDLGKQKILQEDYEGAIEIFNQAIKILPTVDNPYLNDQHRRKIANIAVRLYENLGKAYFKIKNYGLALDNYKKGLSFDPYRATLYKSIADIYYVQNKLDEAIELNMRGLMLNPADYHWPMQLSLLYRDKKDITAAKDYLNQALKLAPDNEELKKYYSELNK